MLRWIPPLALAAGAGTACAGPPKHIDPVPFRDTEPGMDAPKPEAAPKVDVGLFSPDGAGAWGDTLKLSPAPKELVAPCVKGHGRGFAWVRLSTQVEKASTTDLVEASPDLPDDARRCIANALSGAKLPPEASAMQLLVYVTFSPE